MERINSKKAFTMIEVVFVIVIIGILSAVALPHFKETRDQATLAKGITTLNTVRAAVASELNRRAMSGDTTAITSLSAGGKMFDKFSADGSGHQSDIIEYPEAGCTDEGCWSGDGLNYTYHMPDGQTCSFSLTNEKFIGNCPKLKS